MDSCLISVFIILNYLIHGFVGKKLIFLSILFFRKALEDIFDLCDLDDNGTMSKDEFNWFNLRTSGEELGADEWEVVEGKFNLPSFPNKKLYSK